MMRSSVDLPEPLGPSTAVSEPCGISSETSSRAWKVPKRFVTLRISIDIGRHLLGLVKRHEDEHQQQR